MIARNDTCRAWPAAGRRPVIAACLAMSLLAVAASGQTTRPADANAPTAASPAEIGRAIDRGTAYLLASQNADGSWGSARRTKDLNIYAPVPGAHHAFRTAVTALCTWALIEAGGDTPQVRAAIDRGEAFLLDNLPKVRRGAPAAIYNNWTHAYSIQALVRMLREPAADSARRHVGDKMVRSRFRREHQSARGQRSETASSTTDFESALSATAPP